MGAVAPSHLLLVMVVIAILFGGKRIAGSMGELGKGLKFLRQEMRDDT
ncbi:MAG: twin-arginine translocase TatA/TatE family subunit [Thermohalobaculum sp.]